MSVKVTVEGLARIPAFCHSVVAGDFIYVSGTLGTSGSEIKLVDGGIAAETRQIIKNFEIILAASNASLNDIVKVNVYMKDINEFADMNKAYMECMGNDPPARITVGRADLALNAAVEMDCIAYMKKEN